MPVEYSDRMNEILGKTPANQFSTDASQPEDAKAAKATVPSYVFPEGMNIKTNDASHPSGELGVYMPEVDPTTVYWHDKNPNTLIHETEHLRQQFMDSGTTQSKLTGERIPVGAMGDHNYSTLTEKLVSIGTHNLVTKYDFGANFGNNPRELFANLTAYKVQQEAKGIEFTKTPLGKALGIEKGSDLSGYIQEHTLVGQDKLYQINKPPTFSERLLGFIQEKNEIAKKKLQSIK